VNSAGALVPESALTFKFDFGISGNMNFVLKP
jgi:hypothetical protein